MANSNRLYAVLTAVRDERKTGKVLTSLGADDTLRSVTILVRDGEIIDISDPNAGGDETGFWDPQRFAFFQPQDNVDDRHTIGETIEITDLLKQLQEVDALAQARVRARPAPTAAPRPSTAPDSLRAPAAAPAIEEPPATRTTALWELSKKIDEMIADQGLDRAETRGKIGLAAGVLMEIDENTSDDDFTIDRILKAAKSILGEAVALPEAGAGGAKGNSLKEAIESINRIIREKGLDPVKTKGEISLRSGIFLEFDEAPLTISRRPIKFVQRHERS